MAAKSREASAKGLAVLIKLFAKKIRLNLTITSASQGPNLNAFHEMISSAEVLPEDVKQGHFAVVAVKGGEPKRFIVKLNCLTDPAFIKLLEEAEEEYGFQQKGVLWIPCRPDEIQTILTGRKEQNEFRSLGYD